MGGSRWIKRKTERVCRRRGRQRGWERFLADFGSRSVLLPSSWTSLVAGVNYWDCTHTHADTCAHTGTWTHTNRYAHIRAHSHSLRFRVTLLALFEPAERGGVGARQTEKQKWRECQSTVGVLYVINGILSSCIVSSSMDRCFCSSLSQRMNTIRCAYGL